MLVVVITDQLPAGSLVNIKPVRICLVGATHVCHNPRLLREADSLSEAGHEVRVVSPVFVADLDESCERQLSKRPWQYQKVDYVYRGIQGRLRSILIRGRRKVSLELYSKIGGQRLGENGYASALMELRKQASSEPADWFIAHAHAALPAAAAAAKKWDARLGFDCEDLLAERQTDPADIVRLIESRYLPDCAYVSVPSEAIALRIQKHYAIAEPLVLTNVFPLRLADGIAPPDQRPARKVLRLHWFGQTIGPGRGIEEAVVACGMLGSAVELHLRGTLTSGFADVLDKLVSNHSVNLRIHPQIDHDGLIRSLEEFDVGLALERPENLGAALTVSNKIGSYLLAGLEIAATDTPGQREILDQIPNAGFLYPAGSPEMLAQKLRGSIGNWDALKSAQCAAWYAARNKFCWDIEKDKLLEIFKQTN